MKTKLYLFAWLLLCMPAARAQQVRVTFLTPDIVRIEKSADGAARQQKSVAVTLQPGEVAVKTAQSGTATSYSSSALKVTVTGSTVTFATRGGKRLLTDGACTLTPLTSGPDKGACEVSQAFTLDKDEPIYGLGMLQNGKLSQRGENRMMVQSNTEDFSNFFQSLKGYGIYWDNYSPTTISDDGRTLTLTSQVGDEVDYYFIWGGTADGVISGMRQLTGHVPMTALWTYGYHQSRERYRSQDELLGVVRGYRKAGIPLDGIIQDWQYWGDNYLWNAMDFLSDQFMNAKGMIDEVHQAGAHISISIWQSFGPMTKPYRDLDPKGLLLDFETWPSSGLTYWPPRKDYPSGVRCYDVYSAEARDIYWNHLRRLYDLGIDAWWMDSTDPDHFTDGRDDYESDLDQPTAMGSWRSVRNIFPLMTVEGVYDHQRATTADKRVFILTRSYYTGQQRTGAQSWSGDTGSSWDTFRRQIPLCLNHTLTGNPNVNTDIGGFFPGGYNRGTATCARNPLFQELYVRWLQFGLFCPMMRSHGESSRREIWEFGKPGEPVYDAIAHAIRMRYKLMPYIYSTAHQVSAHDDSFMRALVMDFPADRRTWDMNDEFLFGRSLLVAPVTHPLYTGDERQGWTDDVPDWTAAKQVEVYLPKGADWYEWSTGAKLKGGRTVTADAALAHCPLYVRAGSIIPLGPDVQYAAEKPWDDMEVRVYPGADGSFTLYEDEGDGYAYEQGAFSTITFSLRGRTLTIGAREGSYPGMIGQRTFRLTTPDGQERTVQYDGNAVTVKL